jgi:hypothetical protein
MHGRNTSYVHTCMAKWSISWDGTCRPEVNHNLVVKLNIQNIVTTERGWLGLPRLGTDAEDSFFPGTSHTYPTWMRFMVHFKYLDNITFIILYKKSYLQYKKFIIYI